MPHVGVQGLRPRDGQHHRGQGEERDREVTDQETHRVGRQQRLEDLRIPGDADHSAGADRHEPHDHHRTDHQRQLRGGPGGYDAGLDGHSHRASTTRTRDLESASTGDP